MEEKEGRRRRIGREKEKRRWGEDEGKDEVEEGGEECRMRRMGREMGRGLGTAATYILASMLSRAFATPCRASKKASS